MSHNCEDEHFDNGHGHDHGHDHTAPIPTNPNQSLFTQIDTSKVRCLNAVARGVPMHTELFKVFLKDQDQRFNCSQYLESDADCQLVVHIPFVGNCKLFSVILRTNDTDEGLSSPKTIKLFKNYNKSIDFDTLGSSKADLTIQHPNNVGITDTGANEDENTFVEHYLPRRVFQNCSSLTLFLEDNWSGDEDDLCRLYYLEIRGEYTGQIVPHGGAPMTTVYESTPNPVDHHKLESEMDEVEMGL